MKEKKPINVEIGQNVKRVREQAGLTQERFAELLGLGEKHISAIECGAVGLSLAALRRMCALLSVPADLILFGPADEGAGEGRAAALQWTTQRLSRLPEPQFRAAKDILDRLLEALAMPQVPDGQDPAAPGDGAL